MAAAQKLPDLENLIYIETTAGRVVIECLPEIAPKHVARMKELVRKKFYDGLSFHRVVPGYLAQGGDPTGQGDGGSGQKLAAEFSSVAHVRGTVAMARKGDIDSADSQFFILMRDMPHLDGKYTVWGHVVSGMEHIEALKAGTLENNGRADNPDKIVSMRIAADVPKTAAPKPKKPSL